jgi:DNA replication factor GINS
MLTDETIRKISEEERNSAGLSKLPDGFFEEVRAYMEKKEKMAREETEKWALDAVKRRLETIFERRDRKILNAAPGFINSAVVPDNMSDEEKKFFERIIECLTVFQKEREGKLEKKDENLVLVTVLDSVTKFVGMNMKTYGPFKKGDIATLPAPNADLLINKGLAEKIEMTDY